MDNKSPFILTAVVLIISVLICSCFCVGCSGGLKQKLTAHEWVSYTGSDSRTYTFFDNGTFKVSKEGFTTGTDSGTWEINGDELLLSTFDQPSTFKDIGDIEVSENDLHSDEWYVSDRFFYFHGIKYIAQ